MLLPVFVLAAALSIAHTVPVGVTVGLHPHYHPIETLYHAQDSYGQYVYGYATPTSTKSETKTVDGVTRGGYSYIDSNGYLQTVQYTADALNGFRVAATNLPKDLPDVAFAKAKHVADYEAIKAEHAHIGAVRYSNPVAVPFHAVPQIPAHQLLPQPVTDLPEVVRARNEHLATLQAAYAKVSVPPQPVQDLPEVVKARLEHLAAFEQTKQRDAALRAEVSLSPVPEQIVGGIVPITTVPASYVAPALPVAHSSQISYTPVVYGPASAEVRSQNGWGEYSYGYVGPLSAHSESRTADGVTRGGYSYIDANGIIQTVHYVADAVHGFRVAATNLPADVNHALRETAIIANSGDPKIAVRASGPSEIYTHDIVY